VSARAGWLGVLSPKLCHLLNGWLFVPLAWAAMGVLWYDCRYVTCKDVACAMLLVGRGSAAGAWDCWLGISRSLHMHPMFVRCMCVLWEPGMLLGLAPGGQAFPVQQWWALHHVCVADVVCNINFVLLAVPNPMSDVLVICAPVVGSMQ
jgi:hypothetical protein